MIGRIDAAGVQLLADAAAAVAGSAPVQQRFDEALLAEKAQRGQLVQQRIDLLGAFGMRCELARKFAARMLAQAQEAQRASFQTELGAGTGARGLRRLRCRPAAAAG